jgi:hypothetical protein
VITVSSSAHASAGVDGVLVLGRADYNRRLAYAKSKLANVMFAYHLSERLRDTRVTSNVVDPGFVLTNFARNNGVVSWLKHIVAHALRRELVLPRKGAESLFTWLPPRMCRGDRSAFERPGGRPARGLRSNSSAAFMGHQRKIDRNVVPLTSPRLNTPVGRHFHTFDALRFFAFLKVFFFHIPATSFGVFGYFMSGGSLAVRFFFVLSGFLITYLILVEKEWTGRLNFKYFMLRRVLRIWPLYYLIIAFLSSCQC